MRDRAYAFAVCIGREIAPRCDTADSPQIGLDDMDAAIFDQALIIFSQSQGLAGGDGHGRPGGELGVAGEVQGCERFLKTKYSVGLEEFGTGQGRIEIPDATGVDHQFDLVT